MWANIYVQKDPEKKSGKYSPAQQKDMPLIKYDMKGKNDVAIKIKSENITWDRKVLVT